MESSQAATSTMVVVSHYNARPTGDLVALLDQLRSVPAGATFRARVVVNRAEDRDLVLPARHAEVEVLYRENTGYNIGAWDQGWREGSPADYYLFLQEECQILQPDWLKVFVDSLADPRVGLVGESLFYSGYSWRRADYYYNHIAIPRGPDGGGIVRIMDAKREVLAKRGIPHGKKVEHLQSLIIASRRDVLEAIDGFLIERSYAYAIGAEFAISKQVEVLGLRVRQVGLKPFRYIVHPQWQHLAVGIRPLLFRWVEPFLPIRVGGYFHSYPRWHRRVLSRFKNYLLANLTSRSRPTIKS